MSQPISGILSDVRLKYYTPANPISEHKLLWKTKMLPKSDEYSTYCLVYNAVEVISKLSLEDKVRGLGQTSRWDGFDRNLNSLPGK